MKRTPASTALWITVVLLLSVCVVGAAIIIPPHRTRQKLEQVGADCLALRTHFASYAVDYCGVYYPPDTSTRRMRLEPKAPLTFEFDSDWIAAQPVGYMNEPVTFWKSLTSPIPYVESLPRDPFNHGAMYGYFCFNHHDRLPVICVLHSPGPDGRTDVDLPLVREQMLRYLSQKRERTSSLFDEDRGFIRELLTSRLYDPTNGLHSPGDLVMVIPWGEVPFGASGGATESWDQYPVARAVVSESDANNPLRQAPELIEQTATIPLYLPVEFKTALETVNKTDALHNHLGRDFGGFFEAPRPLTESEMAAWKEWSKSLPEFWGNLNSNPWEYDWEVNADEFFTLMPVLGKCLLLKSAVNLNGEDPYKSSNGPNQLICLLDYNRPRCAEPLPPHQQRVFDELTRLSKALHHQANVVNAARQAERTYAQEAIPPTWPSQ